MEITYLGHSGFSVKTDKSFLLFDYIGDAFSLPEGRAHYALVSHAHSDHDGKAVHAWQRDGRLMLIGAAGVSGADHLMSPGDHLTLGELDISAYGSTDEGVSFLIRTGEKALFHAGDLNLWHWKDESTDDEIEKAYRDFKAILASIGQPEVDIAFFPVDARQGTDYDEGARIFAHEILPKVLIPMHFTGNVQAAEAFAKVEMPSGVHVHIMTRPGEKYSGG